MTRLHFLAEVNPTTPEFDQVANDEEVTFLPLEAVWPGTQLDTSRLRPKSEAASGYTRFREGDILVPKITPTFQANRTARALGLRGGVGAGTTELHVIRTGPRLDSRYATYLLSSRPFLLGGEAEMIGVAGQKRVPESWVKDLTVPVTSLAEQRVIADFLDAETARIDALIAKKRRQKALVERRWKTAAAEGMRSLSASLGTNPLKRLVHCLDGGRVPLSGENELSGKAPSPITVQAVS